MEDDFPCKSFGCGPISYSRFPFSSVPLTTSADSDDAVFFAHDGENAPSTMVDRFKSVMIDENGDQRTDENGNLLYEIGPHPNDLLGKIFLQPDKDTAPNS